MILEINANETKIDALQLTVDNLNDISVVDVKAQADQALIDYDAATGTDVTTSETNVIAEVNANEAKIDSVQTSIDNLNDFNPAVDQVIVATNNDKTGYSIAGTKTTLDVLNDLSAAQVNAEVDQALIDYDGPTKAELDAAEANIIAEVDANEVKIDALQTSVDDIPTNAEMDADFAEIKQNQVDINAGVKKSSKIIPHNANVTNP